MPTVQPDTVGGRSNSARFRNVRTERRSEGGERQAVHFLISDLRTTSEFSHGRVIFHAGIPRVQRFENKFATEDANLKTV